jgi:sensor histidine kinase YesM
MKSRNLKAKVHELHGMYTVRMIAAVMLIQITTCVMALAFSILVLRQGTREIRENEQSTLEVYGNLSDVNLKRAQAQINSFAFDSLEVAALNSHPDGTEKDYYRAISHVAKLSHDMENLVTSNPWVGAFYCYFPERNLFVCKENGGSYADNKNAIDAFMEKAAEDETSRDSTKWSCVLIGKKHYLIYFHGFRNYCCGCWMELDTLANNLSLKDDSQGFYILCDGNGNVLWPDAEEENAVDLSEHCWRRGAQTYYILSKRSEQSDLVIVRGMSNAAMLGNIPAAIWILLACTVLSFVMIPLLYRALRRWVIKPVAKLNDAMDRVSAGEVDYRIPEQTTGSEFEKMNQHFNRTLDEVQNLKNSYYEEQIKEQKIRMQFLSQQIQPHFILNTLNILYSYEKDEYPLIKKMILNLSKYFRYIVNANANEVPLKAEMEHIRTYFKIQQTRFPDTFFAFVEYDKEIGNCMVPPLLIQNFAENSIKHSISIGNHIDIFVIAQKLEEDKILVRMLDTGKGIDQALLRKIHAFQETGTRQEGLGVGIQNAIERLQVLYGAKTSFEIRQDPPHGTRIEIILPLKRGENDEEEDEEEDE